MEILLLCGWLLCSFPSENFKVQCFPTHELLILNYYLRTRNVYQQVIHLLHRDVPMFTSAIFLLYILPVSVLAVSE